jgi:hypothetical protein
MGNCSLRRLSKSDVDPKLRGKPLASFGTGSVQEASTAKASDKMTRNMPNDEIAQPTAAASQAS